MFPIHFPSEAGNMYPSQSSPHLDVHARTLTQSHAVMHTHGQHYSPTLTPSGSQTQAHDPNGNTSGISSDHQGEDERRKRRSIRQRSVSGLLRRRVSGKRKDSLIEREPGPNLGGDEGASSLPGIGLLAGPSELRRQLSQSKLSLQLPNDASHSANSPSVASNLSSTTPASMVHLDLSRVETPKSTIISLSETPSSLSMTAAPGTTDAKRLEELAFKLSSETWFNILSKPGHLRTNEELNYLIKWCKTVSRDVTKDDNEAFFQTLEDPVLRQLVKYFNIELAPKYTYVFHEGEVGDTYYLILRGRVGLYVKQQHQTLDRLSLTSSRSSSNLLNRKHINAALESDQSEGDGLGFSRRDRGSFSSAHPDFVRELEQGQEFGERALALDVLRGASVRTLEDCVFLTLDRTRYKIALKFLQEDQSSPMSRAFKEKYVRSTYPLTLLPPNRRSAVVYQLKYEQFNQGEIIYQSGEISERVYFVIEGEVDIMRRVLLPASDEFSNFFNVINLSGDADYNSTDSDSDSEMPIPQSRISNIDHKKAEGGGTLTERSTAYEVEFQTNSDRTRNDFEEILAIVQGKTAKEDKKSKAPRAYLQSQEGAHDDWHKLLQATESASESDASHSSVTLTTDKGQIEIASASAGLGPALPLLASAAAITARQKAQREAELAWMSRRYSPSKVSKLSKIERPSRSSTNGFLDPNSIRPLGMPTPKCYLFAGGKVIGSPLLGYHRVPKPKTVLSIMKRNVDKSMEDSLSFEAMRCRSHLPGTDNTLELEVLLGRIGITESKLLRSVPDAQGLKDDSGEADGCLFGHEEGVLPLSALFPPRGVVFVDRPITEPDCRASINADDTGFWPEQRILDSKFSSIPASNLQARKRQSKLHSDSGDQVYLKDKKSLSSLSFVSHDNDKSLEVLSSSSTASTPVQLQRKLTPRYESSLPLYSYNPPTTQLQGACAQNLLVGYPRSTKKKKSTKFTFESPKSERVTSICDSDSDEFGEDEGQHTEVASSSVGLTPPGVKLNQNALSLLPPAGLGGMSLALALSGYDAIQSNSSSGLGIQIRDKKEGLPNAPIPVRSSSTSLQNSLSFGDLGGSTEGNADAPYVGRERVNVRTGGVWSRFVARPDITKNAAGDLVKTLKPSPLDCILEDRRKITSPRRHFTVYATSRTVHVYSLPLADFLKYFDRTRRLLIRAAAFDRLNLYHGRLIKVAGEPASDFATFAAEETQRQIKAKSEHNQTLSAKESRSLHLSHMKAMKELQDRDQRMISALKRILAPNSQTTSIENSKTTVSGDSPKAQGLQKFSPKANLPSLGSPRTTSTFSPSQQTSVLDHIFRRSEYLSRKGPLPSVTEDEHLAAGKAEPELHQKDQPTVLGGSTWLPSLAPRDRLKARGAQAEVMEASKRSVEKQEIENVSSKLMSFSAVQSNPINVGEAYSTHELNPELDLAREQTALNSSEKLEEADITAEQARTAVSILRSASRASRNSKDESVLRRGAGTSVTSKVHGIKLADTPTTSGLHVRRKSIIHGSLNATDVDAVSNYENKYLCPSPLEGSSQGLSENSFMRSASPDQRPIPILDTSNSTAAAMIVAVSQKNSNARRKSISTSSFNSPPASPRSYVSSRRSSAELTSGFASQKASEEGKSRYTSKKSSKRRGSQPDIKGDKSAKLPTLTQARIVAAAAASLVSRLTKSMNVNIQDRHGASSVNEEGQYVGGSFTHESDHDFESSGGKEDEEIAKLFETPESGVQNNDGSGQSHAVSRYLLELAEEEKKWNEEEVHRRQEEEEARKRSQLSAIRGKGKVAVSNKFDLLAAVATSGERFPLTGASGTHVPLQRIAARVADSLDAYSLSIEERQKNLEIMIRDITTSNDSKSTAMK